MLLVLALFVCAGAVSAADNDTLYVNDTGGNDDNNGTSWEWAKKSILNATKTVNINGTIYIANGQYKGENNTRITIDKNMTIIGESQTGTIINGTGTSWIFHIEYLDINVIIQNLTVTNGTGVPKDSYLGGAILNKGNLTVENCTFTDNTAEYGGAIYNEGNLTVENCTFTDNTAEDGGAIFNTWVGACNVKGCTFTGNTATSSGGAIFHGGNGIFTITDSSFTNNSATYGGAIAAGNRDLIVENCTFTNNTAEDGGAIMAWAGSTLNIFGCSFIGNTANRNGGAINFNCPANINYCTFINNTANGNGESIYIWTHKITKINFNRFYNNTAIAGEAIYSADNSDLIDAENNWWGSNNPVWGSLIYGFDHPDNWVILSINAAPNSIKNGETSTITADLNHINDGGDLTGGHIPDGPLTLDIPWGSFTSSGITHSFTADTVDGVMTATFYAIEGAVSSFNPVKVTATVDNYTTNNTEAAYITINQTAYVDITKEFRNLPWGHVITSAYYNDKIYAIVRVSNSGPDSTSLSVLDSLTGITWTGTYYVLPYLIPNIQSNWIVNDTTNTFNGTHWNIPVLGSGLGGTVKWLAIEGIISQIGTVSNYAETVDQSAYPYDGYDSYTAYLTTSTAPTNLTIDNVRGNKDETVILKATLKDHQGNPLIGKTAEFWVDSVKVGENTTDINGIATFDYKIAQTPGNHTLEAVFHGNTHYLASNITGQVYVPQSDLYIKITSNNNNPKVGKTFTITYKLGNNGPDEATNVTITIPLPEGFKYTDISGDGDWTYNANTNTITWTMANVPVGDPYLYISGHINEPGAYVFSSSISSETYNINTEGVTPVTISAVSEVKAASKTIPMQNTGLPISWLILAVLAVFSGLAASKRK